MCTTELCNRIYHYDNVNIIHIRTHIGLWKKFHFLVLKAGNDMTVHECLLVHFYAWISLMGLQCHFEDLISHVLQFETVPMYFFQMLLYFSSPSPLPIFRWLACCSVSVRGCSFTQVMGGGWGRERTWHRWADRLSTSLQGSGRCAVHVREYSR